MVENEIPLDGKTGKCCINLFKVSFTLLPLNHLNFLEHMLAVGSTSFTVGAVFLLTRATILARGFVFHIRKPCQCRDFLINGFCRVLNSGGYSSADLLLQMTSYGLPEVQMGGRK